MGMRASHSLWVSEGCETCSKGGWLPPKQYVEDGKGYNGAKGCLTCGLTWQEKLAKVTQTAYYLHTVLSILID